MGNEVEVMDAVTAQNYQAAHSVMVMEQWGGGEVYNEERWIERGRHAVRQTLEGMFELGRTLIILKEHIEYRRFSQVVKDEFGIGASEASRLMRATQRFATPQMQKRDASGNLKYLGSMQREFANRSATTANQIQIFKNGISELGIRLGSIVLPAVNAFLSKCIKLTSMISDWAEKHPVLTKGIVGTAASLLAFKVGMFGAMVIVNRARAGILALKSGLLSLKATAVLIRTVMQGGLALSDVPGTLGTVMRGFAAARTVIAGFGLSSLAALWPVVLAVAAVAAVAFVIYKYWKPLKAFFAGFWEGLTKGLEPLTPLFDAFD